MKKLSKMDLSHDVSFFWKHSNSLETLAFLSTKERGGKRKPEQDRRNQKEKRKPEQAKREEKKESRSRQRDPLPLICAWTSDSPTDSSASTSAQTSNSFARISEKMCPPEFLAVSFMYPFISSFLGQVVVVDPKYCLGTLWSVPVARLCRGG